MTGPIQFEPSASAHRFDADKKRRVLVVDDDPSIRALLATYAKQLGAEVTECGNGRDALELLRRDQRFDAVLLDVMMPHMTGIEMIAALRAEEKEVYTPIVLVTGEDSEDDIKTGFSVGADDYVVKPPRAHDILMRLRSAFRVRDLATQLRLYVNEMESQLQEARDLQTHVMPEAVVTADKLTFASVYRPCLFVAGDILNYFRLDEDHWSVYLADVSGHGVPAAMLSLWVNRLLQPTLEFGALLKQRSDEPPHHINTPAGQVCADLDALLNDMDCERYLTIAYLTVNEDKGTLQYCLGGHPCIYVQRGDEFLTLDVGGPPPGLGIEAPFEHGEFQMQSGDRVFLYSDGITEALSPEIKLFDDERMLETLRHNRERPLSEQLNAVINAIVAHHESDQLEDDATMVAFEWRDE